MDQKDYIIKDPAIFRAEDGSYHGNMNDARKINESHWNMIKKLAEDPTNDVSLPPSLVEQILSNPTAKTILKVLLKMADQKMQQQFNEEEKGMKR